MQKKLEKNNVEFILEAKHRHFNQGGNSVKSGKFRMKKIVKIIKKMQRVSGLSKYQVCQSQLLNGCLKLSNKKHCHP